MSNLPHNLKNRNQASVKKILMIANMYLKKPPWSEDVNFHSPFSSSPSQSPVPPSSSSSTPSLPPGVQELVKSLNRQRLYREITLALRTALRDATAEFSFLRVKGLNNLLKFLASIPQSDHMIQLFRESQTHEELQVIPVLFKYSLCSNENNSVSKLDDASSQVPVKTFGPTSDEVVVALRVLEGCCLLDRDCRTLAQQHMAIKEVSRFLSAGSSIEQSACLDALMALVLDLPMNLKEFERRQGVRRVAEMANNNMHVNETVRLKCIEFLLLLVGNVLSPPQKDVKLDEEEGMSVMQHIQECMLEVLGEEIEPLLWTAQQLGSTSDPETKRYSLHYHAQQLLDHLQSKI